MFPKPQGLQPEILSICKHGQLAKEENVQHSKKLTQKIFFLLKVPKACTVYVHTLYHIWHFKSLMVNDLVYKAYKAIWTHRICLASQKTGWDINLAGNGVSIHRVMIEWVFKLKEALSELMLCVPVFIFTSGSSALLGKLRCVLSVWLWLLAIFNPLGLCQFFSWENGQNTKILEVRHFPVIGKWLLTVTRCAKH